MAWLCPHRSLLALLLALLLAAPLAAPLALPGRFSLRVDLLGFRSTGVPPFTLAAGDSVERAIRIALPRVRLAAATVTADAACGAPDPTHALAASLWHQARTALEATRLA